MSTGHNAYLLVGTEVPNIGYQPLSLSAVGTPYAKVEPPSTPLVQSTAQAAAAGDMGLATHLHHVVLITNEPQIPYAVATMQGGNMLVQRYDLVLAHIGVLLHLSSPANKNKNRSERIGAQEEGGIEANTRSVAVGWLHVPDHLHPN